FKSISDGRCWSCEIGLNDCEHLLRLVVGVFRDKQCTARRTHDADGATTTIDRWTPNRLIEMTESDDCRPSHLRQLGQGIQRLPYILVLPRIHVRREVRDERV